MIYLKDAFLLARTKLRLRILRLSLTIFISSLLFSVLIFISFVGLGVIKSATEFNKEGLSGKFIVIAQPVGYELGDGNLAMKQLEDKQKSLIARKKELAKQLNVTYIQQEDQSLPIVETKNQNGTIERYINYQSLLVNDYVNELNANKKVLSYESFIDLAKQSGATNTYLSSTNLTNPGFVYSNNSDASYKIINSSKKETSPDVNFSNGPPKGLDSLINSGWSYHDKKLLEPFLLLGQNLEIGDDGSIPVIAPFSAAEEILGIKSPAPNASTEDRIKHIENVRDGIKGKTADVCYRNSGSNTLFKLAIDQQKDIEQNKSDPNYVKPSLTYKPSDRPCEPVTVQSDNRTIEEKQQNNNQEKFNRFFSMNDEPKQNISKIRIVGLVKDPNYEATFNADTIISSVMQSSLGFGWFIPANLDSSKVNNKLVFESYIDKYPVNKLSYYAEFTNLNSAKEFIKNYNCPNSPYNLMSMPKEGFNECLDKNQPFFIYPYGNNAGAIDQIKNALWSFVKYVVVVVIVLASLIMLGNISKIIVDSRRETAVFRALGAKRSDIIAIYFTYSFIISVIVFCIALSIGFVAAYIIDKIFGPIASINAVMAYNSQDIYKEFNLLYFDVRPILLVALLILLTAFISTLIPLLSNVKRNPIKDMRDQD